MDLSRSEKLLGASTMAKLAAVKVVIFGVGGVGSWCAEALVRTGLKHLTIVDSDMVEASNLNRQLMATEKTIGEVKVLALKTRLEEIAADAEIVAIEKRYDEKTAADFHLSDYDIVIDAIDSVDSKALLIRRALDSSAKLFSSMGAALKLDALALKVAPFRKIEGDGLARALRGRFKREGGIPEKAFTCVYSSEQPQGEKTGIKGSLAHVTGAFGFALAGEVLKAL